MKAVTPTLKIERGIPLPTDRKRRGFFADTLRAMKVGDSFAVDERSGATVRTTFQRFAPLRFTCRRQEDGTLRVWRIA